LLPEEAVGTCGTQERISSWYTFTAQRAGLLAFIIQPNDVTGASLTDYSVISGHTDYDFLLFKLPQGETPNNVGCGLLRSSTGNPSPYQVACNYSGQPSVTGVFDLNNAVINTGTGPGGPGTPRFERPFHVNAGDVFVLLVDNFSYTTVGYKIKFFTPADSSRYADVTRTEPFGISTVSYDPSCQGNCPVTLKFSQTIRCADLHAEIFSPSNIGTNLITDVFCLNSSAGFTDSILVFGNFNPADTTLQVFVANFDTLDGSYLYKCSAFEVQGDTVLLKPKKGYRSVTATAPMLSPYFRVAPNPFTNQIAITLPTHAKYTVTVYEATGRQVYQEANLAGNVTVALPPLPPGLYTVDIYGGGQRRQQRLQKQ
jgi:hypothetical protein